MASVRRDCGIPEKGGLTVMPCQYHPERSVSGTRRLMVAVLERAMDDLRTGSPAMRRQTLAWMRDTEGRWPFAFPRLCDALGLDAAWILAGAMARYGLTRDGRHRWGQTSPARIVASSTPA